MYKLLHSCFVFNDPAQSPFLSEFLPTSFHPWLRHVNSLLHPCGHLSSFLPTEVSVNNHLSHFSLQTQLPSLFSPSFCTISMTPSPLSLSCLPFLLSFSPVSRPHYNTTTFKNIFLRNKATCSSLSFPFRNDSIIWLLFVKVFHLKFSISNGKVQPKLLKLLKVMSSWYTMPYEDMLWRLTNTQCCLPLLELYLYTI